MVISASGISELRNRLKIETNRLAKRAVQKPEIVKPDTSLATSSNISALSTSRKKPSVRKVSGRVSNTSRGQSTALAKPSSRAETIRLDLLAKRIPLKTRLATHRETAVMP